MKKDNKPEVDERQQSRSICRAMITPAGEGSEGYDFECVAVPATNGQLRYSWENEEYFMQVLSTEESNVKRERLESGLNLFDNHPYDLSAQNTLGITVGYEFTAEGLVVRCRWGARADEALRNDVANGVIKTVSIEGDVHEYTVTRNPGQIPTYTATLWEPTSLSFAPVPQDIASQIDVKRALEKQIKGETKPNYIDLLTKNLKR